MRTARAHVSHLQQPALPKIALDIKVPLLRVGRTETPNGEEEEARKRPPACAPEDGRTRCSVKASERGYHLISRKWKCGIWQDARERICRRHGEFLRADGFGEGQAASGLQKRVVRDALIVDTVSRPNHGFLIAEYIPS